MSHCPATRRACAAALGLTCAMAFAPLPARALNIVLVYDASTSSNNPAYDPNAIRLGNILEYVASVFEDIIEDDHTITIDYQWDSQLRINTGFSGQHNFGAEVDGRETEARVRFDSTIAYYIDPTPWDDSEYNMQQLLTRGMSANLQAARFTGTASEVMEFGFRGAPVAGAPSDAANGLDAQNGMDLVTLAFQEIGHALGMSASFSGTVNQVGQWPVMPPDNGLYDVNPAFNSNDALFLIPRGTTTGGGIAHLAGSDAVMANLSSAERTRPSAADIFALAAGSNWTQIDLPRKDFIGEGSSWQNNLNWLGGRTPDNGDDVFIRLQATTANVFLTAFGAAGNLFVESGNSVRTGDNTLFVQENATITGFNSRVRVQEDGRFRAERIDLASGGFISLEGGEVEADRINIGLGSEITGSGQVKANTSGIGLLDNRGTIRPTGNGIVLLTDDFVAFDLDGSTDTGVVDASAGSLVVGGGLTDGFDGDMFIGPDQFVGFAGAWSLGKFGDLFMTGAPGEPARVTSQTITDLRGEVIVDGPARIESPFIELHPTVTLEVSSPGDRLSLNASAGISYFGGLHVGNGVIEQNGDATIYADTTINAATYDLDGTSADSQTTIQPGVTFRINSDRIDDSDPVTDGFDGTLHNHGGTFIVNTAQPWRHEGVMNLTQMGAVPVVDGQEIIVIGQITAGGIARILSDVNIRNTAHLMAPGTLDSLELHGQTTFRGGTYTGLGRIAQMGDAVVATSTTIDVATYDMDGAGDTHITIIPSVTFTINSNQIDVNPQNDGFDGTVLVDGGTLAVNTQGPWRMDGQMDLMADFEPARVQGSTMIVHGRITSDGNNHIEADVEFMPSAHVSVPSGGGVFPDVLELRGQTDYFGGSFTGDGRIAQRGDALVLANTTVAPRTFDWDGLDAAPSSTWINPGVTFTINSEKIDTGDAAVNGYDGTVTVGGGRLVVNTLDPWRLDGQMNLLYSLGSAVVDGVKMVVGGNIQSTGFINGIFSDIKFEPAAQVSVPNLGDVLQLLGNIEYCGGSYTGQGTLMQFGDAVVMEDTTIAINIFDWDGGGTPSNTLIQQGKRLRINSNQIEAGLGGPTGGGFIGGYGGVVTIESAAVLEVNTPQPWILDGTAALLGGRIAGSAGMVNDGLVIGHGLVAPSAFVNNEETSARDGQLILASDAFPDLDGEFGNGVLNAIEGDLLVRGDLRTQFPFSGRLNAHEGHEFRMLSSGLFNRGVILLTGGTYIAPDFTQAGTLLVREHTSTLDSESLFIAESVTQLLSDLEIVGMATFDPGASVTGSGRLIITDGALVMGEGNLDVEVVNAGDLEPGNSPGTFRAAEYTQTATGRLGIEIHIVPSPDGGGHDHDHEHGGDPSGIEEDMIRFDELRITGQATLAGTLGVSLSGTGVPQVGQEFEFLTAGSIAGGFERLEVPNFDHGVTLRILPRITGVSLMAIEYVLGDMNGDGVVDAFDVSLFELALADPAAYTLETGLSADIIGDISGDGVLNAFDVGPFEMLLAGGPPIPEPASAVLILAASGMAATRRRRNH